MRMYSYVEPLTLKGIDAEGKEVPVYRKVIMSEEDAINLQRANHLYVWKKAVRPVHLLSNFIAINGAKLELDTDFLKVKHYLAEMAMQHGWKEVDLHHIICPECYAERLKENEIAYTQEDIPDYRVSADDTVTIKRRKHYE